MSTKLIPSPSGVPAAPRRRRWARSGGLVAVLFLFGAGLAAAAEEVAPVIPERAHPLPLSAVRLTGGPLQHAHELDASYLLRLEPDRMLAFLRQRAGLAPKARGYGGWDGGTGKQLTGHIAGHYLSAVSYMWSATGDPRFKQRVDYMVSELREIQDQRGDGYIGALTDNQGTDGRVLFQELARGGIRSGGFDLNGLWSPWYVEHKLFAGLRDAYRNTGNRTALEVELKFAAWAEGILAKLDHDQIQRMLNTEFGGMNEVLAGLYADTGDRRWLALSDKFQHEAIVNPLAERHDILAGKHANTQVPKMIGSLVRHVYTGNEVDGNAARFFWEQVALHHSFATGGHGRNEYFGRPDRLNGLVDGRTAETCNVYNMLKMTRALFAIQPDIRYADFAERALYNHILGSMDPLEGWTCYMVPVGRGVTHEYERNMLDGGFTCCVGSGMESHALHGYGLYYQSGDKLWVNQFVPSTAEWKEAGLTLTMETQFPEGESVTLAFALRSPRELTVAVRRPHWAGKGFALKVNDRPVRGLPGPGAYVEVKRTWQSGDRMVLVLPKALRLEPLPDNARRVAVLWGPLVLAGDLGPEPEPEDGRERRSRAGSAAPRKVPVFVAADRPVSQWLKAVPGKPGTFHTEGVGRDREVEFVPFYRLHRRTYGIYWDLFTPGEWRQQAEAVAAAGEKQRRLEAATVGYAQPGEMQPETDHNYQGEGAKVVRVMERAGRRGGSWFAFDLPVDPAHPMRLVVTYHSDERQSRRFAILVDGERVGEQTVERRTPEQDARFFDVEYVIPAEVMNGKRTVTVRFEAAAGGEVGTVCGIRTVRADAVR